MPRAHVPATALTRQRARDRPGALLFQCSAARSPRHDVRRRRIPHPTPKPRRCRTPCARCWHRWPGWPSSAGLPYAALEESLKQAVVQAAAAAHPQVAPQRSVSRISTATGINRREVTRPACRPTARAPRRPRSLASELFAHWLSDPAYRDARAQPRVLPRLGAAPSFETLAQAVTRDVHPRSLLDELLRLKLATLDEDADTVALLRGGFVPRGDRTRMLGFLADNVGDHLRAAVDNLLADGSRHFEQAMFADGLSADSVRRMRGLIGPQWKALLETLVPALEQWVRTRCRTARRAASTACASACLPSTTCPAPTARRAAPAFQTQAPRAQALRTP